ncbi:TetR family transcriptional regulator [Corynebacterium sp. CNJ-954]|uniref:TetR/AcrR family transcriptional regulator n=1 Tax=Corynebacterium sp. CNJ-954 TaxID=1904962 RepID=UPI00095C3156|nr:TetR/AcrR family transcriptional regulator [Corynebacterium sp. CNJ-954]OLT54618.1 TetR family transcriptional regulator [Corynebacterium sp. CNJ-954]
MSQPEDAPRGRGRRPAAEVRDGVLTAASRLLLAEGMSAVTFERVAKAAGASKTTLYKWWPSPGALAAEAFFTTSELDLEFPDTGNLHADLVAQLTAFVRLASHPSTGKPLTELIGTAQIDPVLARAWTDTYSHPRRELARQRLHSAQRDGELHADADLDIMVDQLWGACYHRLLILKVPLDELNVDRLVTYALRGAQ